MLRIFENFEGGIVDTSKRKKIPYSSLTDPYDV